MLTIKLHPSFSKYVEKSISRGTYLIESLPNDLRGTLYMSLSKALDNSVKTDISWDDTEESDSILILARMESEFGLKQKSTLNTLDLVTTLNNLKKGKDEKLPTYYRCFKQMIEECRVNNVLSFGDTKIAVLYMHNLNEPCLVPTIINMEQGSAPEWSSVTSLDALYEKVKSYLKAYTTLTPSTYTPRAGGSTNCYRDCYRDRDCVPKERTDQEKQEYNKRMRHISGGLRGDDPDKITARIVSMIKAKDKGCHIHDHTDHTLAKCQRMQSLCTEHNCLPSLKSAISKTASSQPSALGLKAKWAKAKIKKEKDDLKAERKEMERENGRILQEDEGKK